VQGLVLNFATALRLMGTAIADCPGELWEEDLWPDEAPTAATSHGGLHGSAPWFLAYHSLLTLDYDLTAELRTAIPTGHSPNQSFPVTSTTAPRRHATPLTKLSRAARPGHFPIYIVTEACSTEFWSAPFLCTLRSTPLRSASSSRALE
jgi:hypothetical protein